MGKNDRILVISDTHFPFNHPDVIAFLKAIKNTYKPTRVIHIGDEIDGHAISFHDSDPDLASPGDEFKTAMYRMKPLYEMFPKVDVLESNHGSLVYRKGKAMGLPRHVFKSYREILGAPKGWKWHRELTIKLPNLGQLCYFCHGKSTNAIKLSQSMGMCSVNGHYHEQFNIQYWSSSAGLFWSMVIGCLIDDDSRAYDYNNTNLKRPIVGTGIILNGIPKLLPMLTDRRGRWTKKLA